MNADHCEDDELCVNNDCRFSCADNPNACENGQYCDAATDTCVDCLEDEQCELGNICENNDCVEGCRTDRDCPSDLLCLDGTCIEGCIEDSDCPLSTFCYENQCTPGCNDDDSRCPENETCEDDVCRFSCDSDEECGEGKLCIETECVAGCRNDDDCGGWTPTCDTSVTPGVCRAGCWNGGCWGDQICNDDNLCVDCVENGDCQNGYSCVDYYCEIDEPLGLCEECRDSRDCGEDNLCLSFGGGWWGGEQFCAKACSLTNDDCPNGYACRQKESVDDLIGAQCVPYTNGGDVPDDDEEVEPYGEISCAAHTEFLENKQCGRREGGGGGPGGGGNWVQCAEGAICSGWGIASTLGEDEDFEDNYTCSIFCAEDSDCPGDDSFCEEIPDDDIGCDEPPCAHGSRCAPNQ
ncbi:MAG: hypothetical protein CMH56_12505 [Myxococcales bacterium]|nr:hypothetical protein [Myxococcales bacterium]